MEWNNSEMRKGDKRMDLEKDVLTVVDVMKLLGVSRPYVYKLIRTGEITGRKVGRRYLILRESVEKLISDTKESAEKK